MKVYTPGSDRIFLETNRSNVLGNTWSTRNLDFQSNLGVVRIAQKLVTNTTTTDSANLGRPVAFEHFDGRIWSVCGTRVYKNSSTGLLTTFAEDASAGAITTYSTNTSDLATFNGRLWSSAEGKLLSKAQDGSGTGAWTDRTSTANLVGSGKLGYFQRTNRLYFINSGNNLGSIDTTNVVATGATDYSLVTDVSLGIQVTFCVTSASIWIGLLTTSDQTASNGFTTTILQWDGISAQPTNAYSIQAAGVLSMFVDDDIPYAVDTEGRVLKYLGYSFNEISRLPINRTLLTNATVGSGTTNGRFIHLNGMAATKNNTLLLLINNLNDDNAGTITENISSGIWECDLATGIMKHRYSFTLKGMASSTVTDFGQNRIFGAGALRVNTLGSTSSSGRSTLLAGATYYTTATVSQSAIFIDSPVNPSTDLEGQKRGYFVSTFMESEEVEEQWGKLWTMFRKFQTATDQIALKYRNYEEDSVEATITWVSTTSFTTTTDISAYAPTATGFDGYTGGEVEVLQGTGSGATPHILSVTNNAGTYTVTLNETVTGVTGTAKARFQKWLYIGTITTDGLEKAWAQNAIPESHENRVQIKVCMAWTGTGEQYRSIMNTSTNIPITQ